MARAVDRLVRAGASERLAVCEVSVRFGGPRILDVVAVATVAVRAEEQDLCCAMLVST